jgi:Tol biopolymer transport system component
MVRHTRLTIEAGSRFAATSENGGQTQVVLSSSGEARSRIGSPPVDRRRAANMRKRKVLPLLAGLVVAAAAAAPAMATYPDHNGRLVFQADTGTGYELYTIRPNGKDLRQVTNVEGDAVLADWSPDGRQIVYEHGSEDFARVEIMNTDGSNVRDLTGTGLGGQFSFAGDPSFTPDGRHIVFSRYIPDTDDAGIWIMKIDGTGQREIGNLPYGDPNVSPDGKTLLMLHGIDDQGRQQALVTSDMKGGHIRQITSYALDAAGKSDWAPNGRRVVTSDNANILEASANIVTVGADGRTLFNVTNYDDPDVRAYVGGYSPNGKWLVFRLEDHGQFALCLIRPDGHGLRTILPLSDFKPRGIDWGPAR